MRSGGVHDVADRRDELVEALLLDAEVLAPCRGDGVVAGALIVRRQSPLGREPSLLPHALERGVEGAFFHLEDVVREAADVLRDAVAVHWLGNERPQDQHVERAGEQLAF